MNKTKSRMMKLSQSSQESQASNLSRHRSEFRQEGRSIGAYSAQTILTQYYGYKYPLIIETETSLEYRNRKLEISKSSDHQLIIEPNPASTEIKVSFYDPLKMMTEIELFGLDGRVHYSKKLVKQLKEYKLDVSFLNSGIYLLKVVSSKDEIIVNKFIKQ